MKNSEFEIGSHITILGNRGIVEKIDKGKVCQLFYKNENCGIGVFNDKEAEEIIERGYTLIDTGKTATYFTVNFDNEPNLAHTPYNHGQFGGNDDYLNYGTW